MIVRCHEISSGKLIIFLTKFNKLLSRANCLINCMVLKKIDWYC